MESVIFAESPLAEYLEGSQIPARVESHHCERRVDDGVAGEGECGEHWASAHVETRPETPQSYAPRGISTLQAKFRRKAPHPLRLDISSRRGRVTRLYETCSVRYTNHVECLE